MPRPMKFDKEAAIETAMQQVWCNGYAATSVKALSEKLGIERGSFYNAFGRREDMFKLVIERYACIAPSKVLYDMDEETPFKPTITRMFRDICDARAADPDHRGCLAVNSLAEFGPQEREVAKFLIGLMKGELSRIRELIGFAIARGELAAETDADSLALALHNLEVGTNLQAKIVHDADNLWSGVRSTLDALGVLDEAYLARG